MRASDWIDRHPRELLTVAPGCRLEEALRALLERPGARDVWVVDEEGRIAGHVPYARLARHVLRSWRPTRSRRQILQGLSVERAGDLMEARFPSVGPDQTLRRAVRLLIEHDVEDLPVLGAGGRILGAVNLGDVLRAELP